MFDSLADQIKHDEHLRISNNERIVYWFMVALISVLGFGGLYLGIHVLH